MPRKPTTRVKSEHHAELARRSIADRPRDARGRLLPRSATGVSPAPSPSADDGDGAAAAGGQPGAPSPAPAGPPADPPSARRRLPWDRRA